MGDLTGLTVLSMEQATTLPFLTQRLARDGARVIRLEPPGRGDPNRHVGRPLFGEEGMGAYFLPNNLGKESITLNLATDEGRDILARLLVGLRVDVFATNVRPSTYVRLGVDDERLRAIRPELIWLGITGFGPDHDEAAYDPVVQARIGWMDLTGEPDRSPLVFGLPMVDLGAAEHAYGAVMKALFRRASTGRGARIDISLFHSAGAWMASPFMLTALGEEVSRRGNTHPYFAPVSVYPTRDGFVYLAVGNDRQWEALVGLDLFADLAEPVYARNAGRIVDVVRLNERLAERTRRWDTSALLEALSRCGIPASRVRTVAEAWSDPLLHVGRASAHDPRSGLEIWLPPEPVVGADSASELRFPPRLGEHNREVYAEALGLDAAGVSDLHERGVI